MRGGGWSSERQKRQKAATCAKTFRPVGRFGGGEVFLVRCGLKHGRERRCSEETREIPHGGVQADGEVRSADACD